MIQFILGTKIKLPANFYHWPIIKRRKESYSNKAYCLTVIVTIFSIIVTIVTFIHSDKAPAGYEYMWLMPLIYGVLFYFTNMRYALGKYLGISILSLILFVRYLILPLFFSLSGMYFHSNATHTDHDVNLYAIFLMIYEMVCIFIALHFFISRLDKQQINKLDDIKSNVDSKYFIYLIVIIIGIISFLFIPEIQDRTNFFLISDDFERREMNAISYICFLFTANTFKVLFIIALTIACKRIMKGYFSQFLILLFALLSIGFFWTTNRLTILAQGTATVALIMSSNILNKSLSYFLILIPIISVFSMSAYRWFGYGISGSVFVDMGRYLDVVQMLDYLLSYFAGPHLISLAVSAEYNLSFLTMIETFANEILSSIIFVQQIFPLSNNSSTVIFNALFGFFWETSFIVPTLGQSYMYFGGFCAPILSVVFLFFIYKVEKALIVCKTLGEKYAYYILLCWLAFFPLQNVNIVSSYIFNIFLPLYLIVIANRIFSTFVVRLSHK